MKQTTSLGIVLMMPIALLLHGCASTKVTAVVSPDAPQYGQGQIMVIADYADMPTGFPSSTVT